MTIIGDLLPASVAALLVGTAETAAVTSSVAMPLSGLTAAVTTPGIAATAGLVGSGGVATPAGLSSALGLVSGLSTIATGVGQAISGAKTAEQQADYARYIAKQEAIAQRAEDQRLKSRQRALYAGAGVTGATPLMVELDTARLIDQRYRDKIYRGQVSAFESRAKIPSLMLSGAATAAGGLSTIASSLYRTRNPLLVDV